MPPVLGGPSEDGSSRSDSDPAPKRERCSPQSQTGGGTKLAVEYDAEHEKAVGGDRVCVCVCVTVSLGTSTPQFAVAKAAEAKIDVGPGDAPSPSRILPEPVVPPGVVLPPAPSMTEQLPIQPFEPSALQVSAAQTFRSSVGLDASEKNVHALFLDAEAIRSFPRYAAPLTSGEAETEHLGSVSSPASDDS